MNPRKSPHLTSNNFPEDVLPYFNIESQVLLPMKGTHQTALHIERTCKGCGQKTFIRTSLVKQALKKNKLTGYCVNCIRTLPFYVKFPDRKHWNFKTGKTTDSNGYITILIPTKDRSKRHEYYVKEHRWVMEQHLGRKLLRSESVHHKNGVKTDNRIKNLELWSQSHSSGQRYEDLTPECLTQMASEILAILFRKTATKTVNHP